MAVHVSAQVREALEEAEQACEGLQHSAGELEARLAELRRWEMDAGQLYRLLGQGQARAPQAPEPRIRVSADSFRKLVSFGRPGRFLSSQQMADK